MNVNLLSLLQKYQNKGLLVDTGVALLYVVGSFDPKLIRASKRTAMFSEDDFAKVSKFIDFFPAKITTPNVLTEISNLLPTRPDFIPHFGAFAVNATEEYLTSSSLLKSVAFSTFGLADSSVFETARGRYLILTDDRRLVGFLANRGVDVVNMDAIRTI